VLIDEPPYEKGSNRVVDYYAKATGKVIEKNPTEKIIEKNPAGWLWSHNRWKKRD